MMTKEGSTMIVNFNIPMAEVLILSSTLSINSTLIAIVIIEIMMLLSDTMVDFHLFYDGAVDIQI